MTARLRIILVGTDRTLLDPLHLRLVGKGYQVIFPDRISELMGLIYSDPADLMIFDLTTLNPEVRSVLQQLKQDSYFSMIPMIGVIKTPDPDSMAWSDCPIDDFVTFPFKYSELFARIALSLHRVQRILDSNPLTRLPGNTSIQRAIEKGIGQPMAVCYLDINQFKPYNDVYGFALGDDVIRMVGRILSNAIKSIEGSFVGHIGGDDFVFIVPLEKAEAICQLVLDHFSAVVGDLFDDGAKTRGFFVAKNRKGEEQKVPLLGIAIAVVPMSNPKINHYGKVSAVAAELKSFAKKLGGSRYVVDRRQN